MESKILPSIIKKNFSKIKYLFIELHGDEILKQYSSSNKEIYKILLQSNFKINTINKNKFAIYRNGKIPSNRHYLMCYK